MTAVPAEPSAPAAASRLRFAVLALALAVLTAALLPAPDGLKTPTAASGTQAAISQALPVAGPAAPIVSTQLHDALAAHRLARGVPSSEAPAAPETPMAAPWPFDLEPAAGFEGAEGLPEAAPPLPDGNALAGLAQRAAGFEGHRAAAPPPATAPAEAAPLAPAPADAAPAADARRGFVVIGSFRNPAHVAQWLAKYAAWQPLVLPALVEGVARSRVVVGPFAKADLTQALRQIRDAGVADAWLLKAPVSAATAFRTLAGLG